MQTNEVIPMQFLHTSSPTRSRFCALRRGLPVLALLIGAGFAQASAAAEVELIGTGTFKPLTSEGLAKLPVNLPFSKTDLASGTWSFQVRYEDRTADSDPDPYVGRYGGAIRAFRLTVGATSLDLPVDRAELIVSDGGLGFPERESIRMQASAQTPLGGLQVSWVQIHQTAQRTDLRGAPGLLTSDALPAAALLANLPTSRPFNRFLLLRVDSPSQAQPLLYLSSSQLTVSARPAIAP